MPELLDVTQLASFLGCSINTVHGLTRQRTRRNGLPVIPFIRLGKRVMFRRESVLHWLAQREVR